MSSEDAVVSMVWAAIFTCVLLFTMHAAKEYVESAKYSKEIPIEKLDKQKLLSGVQMERFNRQTYVQKHREMYGVRDAEDSLDGKEIYSISYEKIGV